MIEIFKALSEESRVRILSLLIENELCVCEIEKCLNMNQSNVSRHLTALKKSGILESYKKAQWAYYKISETFKTENNELWLYLQKKIIECPNYKTDLSELPKCKIENLCNKKN